MIQLQSEEDLFAIGQALSFKIDAEIDRELENGQWLRFAEAAIASLNYGDHDDEFESTCQGIADFADAMVREAKERGRL